MLTTWIAWHGMRNVAKEKGNRRSKREKEGESLSSSGGGYKRKKGAYERITAVVRKRKRRERTKIR